MPPAIENNTVNTPRTGVSFPSFAFRIAATMITNATGGKTQPKNWLSGIVDSE